MPTLTRGSSLGSLRSSPGDPERNIDWVLMLGVFGIVVIGLPTVYSTSYRFLQTRARPLDPFLYTQRQVVFAAALPRDNEIADRIHRDTGIELIAGGIGSLLSTSTQDAEKILRTKVVVVKRLVR